MMIYSLILSILISTSYSQETFTNPIIDGNSADPFVGRIGNFYYLLLSTRNESEITIYKSSELTNFRNVESKVIFQAPNNSHNIWASEMHEMSDGNLYIYFAMAQIGNIPRTWAIKAEDPKNPMGNWSQQAIRLLLHFDAIPTMSNMDGTILNHNKKTYYVWSGQDRIEGSLPRQSILISEMTDPVTTKREFAVIRQPHLPWEENVNDAPFFIYNKNVSYLVFGASSTFSENRCAGLMSIDEGLDPMVPSNWWNGPEDGPIFYSNAEEHVWGVGNAAFTVSPDGTETWMIYHASEDYDYIEHYRVARAEKISWDPNGGPVFPRPHGYYSPQQTPRGQNSVTGKSTFTNPIISGDSPDPHILLLNGTYYLTIVTNLGKSVTIHSSKKLTNFRNAVSKSVNITHSCLSDCIWAPKLVVINEELYMYLSIKTSNSGGAGHHVSVMKASDPTNPLGEWSTIHRLLPEVSTTTADADVLQRAEGLYFVYAAVEFPVGLWIARMTDPMTVNAGTRKSLKAPTESWEDGVVNGPAFVHRGNVTFMTYTAGMYGGPDICTGIMSISDNADPMVASNWNKKLDGPVLYRNDEQMVYATDQVVFTTSPDGTETWITYHASEYPDRVNGNRVTRAEKIEWNNNGEPVFPRPHGYFSPQPLPSGEK